VEVVASNVVRKLWDPVMCTFQRCEPPILPCASLTNSTTPQHTSTRVVFSADNDKRLLSALNSCGSSRAEN
jgi:hypothetical protein